MMRGVFQIAGLCAVALLTAMPTLASSHREAPGILRMPEVDGTDFYMFRSYESGREGFVTLIANYNPLQDPFGGPNYYPLDPNAVYDIHISNDGATGENLTFRVKPVHVLRDLALDVGDPGSTERVSVPLMNIGPFGAGIGQAALNVQRRYQVELIAGDVDAPISTELLTNVDTGGNLFESPADYIGVKSIPDYETYADKRITEFSSSCGNGRVFVGQRKESFAVNLGETFDLVNVTDPLGDPAAEASSTENKNITTLAIEVPIACLTGGEGDVIAGWTTARLKERRRLTSNPTFDNPDRQGGDFVTVSRLANPLVNEVVIGLKDKNLWNASHPADDAQFLTYVTHPTLPELIEILFATPAPNNFPRNDLVWIFLTGIPGVNEDGSVAELMRLNTAIAPLPSSSQSNLGFVGDGVGYPNGRRPGDDTVDISLRAAMGLLCHLGLGICDPTDAPSGLLPFTDGTAQNAQQFSDEFPYLTTPIPGSPNSTP